MLVYSGRLRYSARASRIQAVTPPIRIIAPIETIANRQSRLSGTSPASTRATPTQVTIGIPDGAGRWKSSCSSGESEGMDHQQGDDEGGGEHERRERGQPERQPDVLAGGLLVQHRRLILPAQLPILIRSTPMATNSRAR